MPSIRIKAKQPMVAKQLARSGGHALSWMEEECTMARACWRPMTAATRTESLSFLPKKGGKGRSCFQGAVGMHRNLHW